MACIAGALIGLGKCFTVHFHGIAMDAPAALDKIGQPPLQLHAKEGLGRINGTSVMKGLAQISSQVTFANGPPVANIIVLLVYSGRKRGAPIVFVRSWTGVEWN